MVLDGEGVSRGELLEALKIWAKGADATYPPRPANLLEVIKRERVLRVRRAELDAWRKAGSPTIDSEGNLHFLTTGDGPVLRALAGGEGDTVDEKTQRVFDEMRSRLKAVEQVSRQKDDSEPRPVTRVRSPEGHSLAELLVEAGLPLEPAQRSNESANAPDWPNKTRKPNSGRSGAKRVENEPETHYSGSQNGNEDHWDDEPW